MPALSAGRTLAHPLASSGVVDRRVRHLERLERHLKDCSPDMLGSALKAFGFEAVRQSGSHRTFRHPRGAKITVPMHRPVKRFYVEETIAMCKDLMKHHDEEEGGEEA